MIETYAERVKATSRNQLELNLANHDRLVASDRWEKLDEDVRGNLEQMAAAIRTHLAPAMPVVLDPVEPVHPFEPFEYAERS